MRVEDIKSVNRTSTHPKRARKHWKTGANSKMVAPMGVSMRYLIVFALLWPPALHAGWFSYDNYEDCMLAKMKGQDRSMYMTADKACKKQFDVEEEITYLGDRMKRNWDYDRGQLTIEITENSTEYSPTRGEFAFSEKSCTEAKDADFGQPVAVDLKNKTSAKMLFMSPVCMRTLRLWGRYK